MKSGISFKKGVSAYYQIKEDIISRINSGEWELGEKIPSEIELVEFYGVSRMTLRKALDELADEEVLYKERGIGTFAAKRQIVRNQEHLSGLSEEMAAQGSSVRSVICLREIVEFPSIARDLEIEDAQVYHLQRLRYVNDEVLLVDDTFMPIEVAESANVEALGETDSLFQFLESTDIALLYGEKEVHAILATAPLAKQLSYKEGHPLFYVKTIVHNQRGYPILVSELHIRSDRYSIKVTAKRH
jgi:DNA-binding GntR family transcriptional regulator